MRRRIAALVAAWVALAAAGWATGSTLLIVAAPLLLLPVPVLMAVDRYTRGTFDPLEPIWLLAALFGFAYLSVPALSTLDPASFTSLPGYLDAPPEQRELAAWLGALAFLALLAGYSAGAGERLARLLPVREGVERPQVVLVTALILFGLGMAAALASVAINDGFSLGLLDLMTGKIRRAAVASFTGRGYLSVGWALLALSAPCAAIWASMKPGRRPWLLVSLITVVSVVTLAGVLGSRILGLGIPLAVLVVVHYRVRRFPLGAVAIAGGIIAAGAIVLLVGRESTRVGGPLSALGALSITLDGFNMLANSLGRVHHFLYGQSVAEDAVVAYIPRGLWTDKPVFYGFIRAQELVVPGIYDDIARGATFPIGIVAEGYVNFAVPGALAFPFIAGVAFRTLYARLLLHPGAYVVALMAWAIPNTLSLMRSLGPMIPATGIALVFLSPLLLARRRG